MSLKVLKSLFLLVDIMIPNVKMWERGYCTPNYSVNKIPRGPRKRIFANGCFDLFHEGHLNLLKQASGFGDLIVGIDCDARVKKLKGRLLFSENFRADLISQLAFVDRVIVFDCEVEDLIQELRPDILVKGDDSVRPVPGQLFTLGAGGDVFFIPCQFRNGRKISSSNFKNLTFD